MTLDDLVSWISDDLRHRDLGDADYITVGKSLIDIVLAQPPAPGVRPFVHCPDAGP